MISRCIVAYGAVVLIEIPCVCIHLCMNVYICVIGSLINNHKNTFLKEKLMMENAHLNRS